VSDECECVCGASCLLPPAEQRVVIRKRLISQFEEYSTAVSVGQ
jgi:hypothetical protein